MLKKSLRAWTYKKGEKDICYFKAKMDRACLMNRFEQTTRVRKRNKTRKRQMKMLTKKDLHPTSCAAFVSFIMFITFGASKTSFKLCLYTKIWHQVIIRHLQLTTLIINHLTHESKKVQYQPNSLNHLTTSSPSH